MSKKHFGMPGIGGSLGKCALCGENFLLEILKNKAVQSFNIEGVEQILYGHDKCIEELQNNIDRNDGKANIKELPDGPLRESMVPK